MIVKLRPFLPVLLVASACAGTGPPAPVPAGPPAHRYVRADVEFMQHMIVHHAQALEMARLVPVGSTREDLHRMAERIDASQIAEIARMRQWLEARNESVLEVRAHGGHAGEHAGMPGLASPEDMARLASLRGSDFDRLFLELMIRHHEGALIMVRDLFATEGAVNEAGLYMLAADIDADQRAEIARLRSLLETLQRGSE